MSGAAIEPACFCGHHRSTHLLGWMLCHVRWCYCRRFAVTPTAEERAAYHAARQEEISWRQAHGLSCLSLGASPVGLPVRAEFQSLLDAAAARDPVQLRRTYRRLLRQVHSDRHPRERRAMQDEITRDLVAVYQRLREELHA